VSSEPSTPRIDGVTGDVLDALASTAEQAAASTEASWRRWAAWYRQARTLTAAGIGCAASHRAFSDGVLIERGEAFHDALELATPVGGDAVLALLATPVTETLDPLPELPRGIAAPVAVRHQVAGIACQQRYLVGYPLRLSGTGEQLAVTLLDLVESGGHDCTGVLGLTLDDLVRYRRVLDRVGLSAEGPYGQLAEAIYPIDAQHLGRFVTTEPVPLEMLEDPHTSGRWSLYLLTENCD
jgi:hypothetical protein